MVSAHNVTELDLIADLDAEFGTNYRKSSWAKTHVGYEPVIIAYPHHG